ncbi:hypothetical protein, partial [Microcoleus sp. Pol12B5]|uniref:hypothetical protein n=1 Tax=Microcoleus sp. Pol12B5 TaxID=3055396 RepID=UPI002FD48219
LAFRSSDYITRFFGFQSTIFHLNPYIYSIVNTKEKTISMFAKKDVYSGDNVDEVEAMKAATLIRIKQVMKISSAKLYKLLESEVSKIS